MFGSIAWTLPTVLYAALGVIVLASSAHAVNRFTRGTTIKSLSETAAADVARLKDMNDVLRNQHEDDVRRMATLEGKVGSLQRQLDALRESVTQTAAVEEFRQEARANHKDNQLVLADIKRMLTR